jgi:hypothetical protein
LPQYQQTRGTLAMLAQWISIAAQDGFQKARTEPLITLGSAPLSEAGFRSVVLGQLGESRLVAAIDTDISGDNSHARALDADSKGPLRDLHRRVGTAILFESSGGQSDKAAHLPELRFALGEPEVDTTSIDNCAFALENKSYFIRKVGSDGYRIGYQATMKKVVSDRRASLDDETEVKPALRKLVEEEFRRGASIPVLPFPNEGTEIPDTPRLTLVVAEPETEWTGAGPLRAKVSEWASQRGKSPRLYPGALVLCLKKPGRDLRDKVEVSLAWKRVGREVSEGTLGGEFDRTDRAELQSRIKDSEEAAKDEVWGDYRFAVVADPQGADGLKVIDLGAGHSSSGETLCGRVIGALKSEALLNESVGAGYIERNWPPALKDSGEWALASLRQSFLNGSLTRLVDPDSVLRAKIVEFVGHGDFGLASSRKADGTYERIWFGEPVPADEIAFDVGVYLLRKEKAEVLKSGAAPTTPQPQPPEPPPTHPPGTDVQPPSSSATRTLRVIGNVPPEVWNRLGTRILPKLRAGMGLTVCVDFTVTVKEDVAASMATDLKQALQELGLSDSVRVE